MFANARGVEWLILLVIVLLLFGARRLPDLARSVGRSMKIFRSEVKDIRQDDDGAGTGAAGTGARTSGAAGTADADPRDTGPGSSAPAAPAPAEPSADDDGARPQ